MSRDPATVVKSNRPTADSSRHRRREAKHRAVQEGIADADAGRLIPFSQIKAWVRSWGSKNELPRPKPPTGSRP